MSRESQRADQKSLRVITGRSADWSALAADCVCFANASGGCLRIGIEDGDALPPATQRIAPELLDLLRQRIGEKTVNVRVAPEVVTAENGAEFIALTVARSVGVASTSDGRYFLRVGDQCRPVVGDDVLHLLNDRPGFPWESMLGLRVPLTAAAPEKVASLLTQLRASDRVKDSVKEKGNAELLRHYGLSDAGVLTNLGALLVGSARDRARLGSAPNVQAIKFDELGQKVNKCLRQPGDPEGRRARCQDHAEAHGAAPAQGVDRGGPVALSRVRFGRYQSPGRCGGALSVAQASARRSGRHRKGSL